MQAKWVSCNSNGSPNISGIRQPGGLKFGVYQPLTECWSHTKFQPNRTSGYKDMANFLILLNKKLKINHISGTTCPIGLKFCVWPWLRERLAHTKFQPSRLTDAGDIGWLIWVARDPFGRILQYLIIRTEAEANLCPKKCKKYLGKSCWNCTKASRAKMIWRP